MATTVSGSFSGTGVSAIIGAPIEGVGTFAITGTFVGKVQIEEATTPAGLSWRKIKGPYSVAHSSSFEAEIGQIFRVRCTSYTSGTISYSITTPTAVTAVANSITGDLAVSGNLAVNGSAGISINGRNAINVGPSVIVIGNGAAPNFDIALGAWDSYIGNFAGAAYVGAGGENNVVGAWACRFTTTGTRFTGIGNNIMMNETVGTSLVAVGTDVMRNTYNSNNCTAIGSDCMKYGSGNSGSVAVGTTALWGNSSNINVGGTATAGDVLRLTVTQASINGGSAYNVDYTVTAGQTTAQMAAGLAAAIVADPVLPNIISQSTGPFTVTAFTATSTNNVVSLTWAGTQLAGPLQPTVAVSVIGAATETMTLADGSRGSNNIAVGYQAMKGWQMTTANANIGIGQLILGAITTGSLNTAIGPINNCLALTTGVRNVALGGEVMQVATTASDNVCIGESAGNAITTSTFNVFIGRLAGTAHSGSTGSNVTVGYNAGGGLTTGGGNTLIGPANGNTSRDQVTTGSNNVSIGNQVAVASATANNQLCIGNFIYGTGLAGTGATISTAKIGLGIKAPAVELDVVGTINASVAYQTAGTQVVGARVTGYAAMTGTPNKAAAYDTATVTLAQLAGRMAQLQADLTTHGLIGA